MEVTILQVDAFANKPFAGNQATVCLLQCAAQEQWMQNVAAEMNLSETAFVVPRNDGGFDLRWFTPVIEVPLCGHATLASAHALWEENLLSHSEPARFHTRSGPLTCQRNANGIEMDFPACQSEPCRVVPAGLSDALGIEPVAVAKADMAIRTWIVELADEKSIRSLCPDFGKLRAVDGGSAIVTSRANEGDFDFVSRFFAPIAGVDEDPVTGSAHCCLGPYWQPRLRKTEFRAFQASRRGGIVGVSVRGERVVLTGQAVTVLRGQLVV